MMGLFDGQREPDTSQHERLRRLGFSVYSASGRPNGWWSRSEIEAGKQVVRVYSDAQAVKRADELEQAS